MELIERVIDPLLFHDIRSFHDWNDENHEELDKIPEGEFFDFFRLIPTYSDRRSFYLAIMDIDMNHTNESLIMKAREFFVQTFSKMDFTQ
jgi:hypothetical protein